MSLQRPRLRRAPSGRVLLLALWLTPAGLGVTSTVGCKQSKPAAPSPAASSDASPTTATGTATTTQPTLAPSTPPLPGLPIPVVPAAIDDPPVEPANSKIKSVTVFSDRARVIRTAPVTFRGEAATFEFKRLPGWVDDGTVRVAAKGGRVVDVKVRRDYLARSTDKTFLDAEAAVDALTRRSAALQDELKVLAAQDKQIASLRAYSMEKLTKDMTAGGSVTDYKQVIEFVSSSLRETAKARREAERQQRELGPALAAQQKRVAELRKLTRLEETTVVVTYEGPSGGAGSLDVTYMLPGATWEPSHELRVDATAPGTVEVVSYAVVTQTSGEDWEGAEVAFSTQSSTDAVRIPELDALTLGQTRSTTRTVKRTQSSYLRAQSAFAAQNEIWNVARQKSSHHDFQRVYKDNYSNLQVIQGKTIQIFRKLQERGTTALFKAQDQGKIRSDGNSVRLRIGRANLKTTTKIIAAPEQSLNAANTIQTTNTGPQPLLPGKVALFKSGAFSGNTDIDFVAKGEKFAMFLNAADHIKLSRALDKKESSLLRGERTRMQLAFIITVENLSAKATALSLADRIPVSQNKDIKIDRVKITPGAKPDSKGLLRWDVTLEPRQTQTFRVSYRVEYPPSVTLTTAPAPSPAAAPAESKPSRQMRSKKKSLNDDLRNLEGQF